jgi:hypothetical protein
VKVDLTGGADPMDLDLPLLDHDRLTRAAQELIANYGKDALAEGQRRARTMKAEGCDGTAGTWEYICQIIRARLCVDAIIGNAVGPNPPAAEKSHRVTSGFSFFETP